MCLSLFASVCVCVIVSVSVSVSTCVCLFVSLCVFGTCLKLHLSEELIYYCKICLDSQMPHATAEETAA